MWDGGDEPEEFEVWADNWPALSIFLDCATQWQYLDGGYAAGLRYEAVKVVMQAHGIRKAERLDMLTDIRTCERAALEAWSRRRG